MRAIADVPHTFRFASTAPFYVEVGFHMYPAHSRDVRFFVQWIDERIDRIKRGVDEKLEGDELESVLELQRGARRVFLAFLEGEDP